MRPELPYPDLCAVYSEVHQALLCLLLYLLSPVCISDRSHLPYHTGRSLLLHHCSLHIPHNKNWHPYSAMPGTLFLLPSSSSSAMYPADLWSYPQITEQCNGHWKYLPAQTEKTYLYPDHTAKNLLPHWHPSDKWHTSYHFPAW